MKSDPTLWDDWEDEPAQVPMHEQPKRNRYAKGKRRGINPDWSPEKAAPPSQRKRSLLDLED